MIRLLTPLLILMLGLVISLYSYYAYGNFSSYGAAFYPTVIGAALSIFSLIDFFMALLSSKNKCSLQKFDIKRDVGSILLITGVILFYILVSHCFGFILATSLILIGLTVPFVNKKKGVIVVLLILLSFVIYFLFAGILLVSLPNGIFFT